MQLRNEWVLVCHGQSENNLKPTITSPEEGLVTPLTQIGREQAAHFALRDRDWDLIISSPYLCTQETAEIFAMAAGIDFFTELDFCELNFGDYIGFSKNDYLKFRKNNSWDTPYPGGESIKQSGARTWNALKKWDKKFEGKRILLVGHPLALTGLECVLTGHLRNRENDLANAEPFALPE